MCIGVSAKAPALSLNLAYWNIHGSTSKEVGNKLGDSDFLKNISKDHIVGLAELHADKNVSLTGYKLLK